jgi:WhiB family redox-sensing transcriptional regulator
VTWVGKVLPVELEPWQDRANCIGTDPELFFPKAGKRSEEAQEVCSRCPVMSQCLEYALSHNDRYGVWGGLSEADRKRQKLHIKA